MVLLGAAWPLAADADDDADYYDTGDGDGDNDDDHGGRRGRETLRRGEHLDMFKQPCASCLVYLFFENICQEAWAI